MERFFNLLLFPLVLCSILLLAGCCTPALVIHRTVIKPAEIKDTIQAEKGIQVIKTDELTRFEEYY